MYVIGDGDGSFNILCNEFIFVLGVFGIEWSEGSIGFEDIENGNKSVDRFVYVYGNNIVGFDVFGYKMLC